MGLADVKEKKLESESIKVLIADDDVPTRILLRAAVSQWGYEVIEAGDGEEAWEILQKPGMPQLLIVDWLMPKLDGIDLCRRVKKEIKHFPYIILLTQLSGTTNIVKGLEAGADEFLSKPFNMAELQSRLSVGARIIQYKSRLAKKTEELKSYCSQITELSALANSVMYRLDEVIIECASTDKLSQNNAQIEKIRQMHTEFKRVVDLIEQISVKHTQESEES